MAVDEASFSTSMLSMVSADTSSMLDTCTPSTMNSGSFDCVMEPPPRTRMAISLPGRPSCDITFTPGSWPCRASATVATGLAASFSPVTEATEPVRSLRFIVP